MGKHTKAPELSGVARFTAFGGQLQKFLPHLSSVLENEDDFVSLLVKLQVDGTCLAVVKTLGEDGGPLVLFGSGYGVSGALFGADLAIQGGRWRPDKPWSPKGA